MAQRSKPGPRSKENKGSNNNEGVLELLREIRDRTKALEERQVEQQEFLVSLANRVSRVEHSISDSVPNPPFCPTTRQRQHQATYAVESGAALYLHTASRQNFLSRDEQDYAGTGVPGRSHATVSYNVTPSLADPVMLLFKVLDSIPENLKEDLAHAQRMAPQLITLESDPMKFIRYHNFDYQAAAMMLISYWRFRKDIFGDRFLLPMIATGDGALEQRDIDFMKVGVSVMLPPDLTGCSVMCMDDSRRLDDDEKTRLRFTFYFNQLLSENERTQSDGVVAINVVRFSKMDSLTHKVLEMKSAFPTRVKSLHFLNCIPAGGRGWVNDGFSSYRMKVIGLFSNECKTYFHSIDDKAGTLKTFQSCGISKEGLPEILGGSWSYEGHLRWVSSRQSQEREKYAHYLIQNNIGPSSNTFGLSDWAIGRDRYETTSSTTSAKISATRNEPEGNDHDFSHEYNNQLQTAMKQLPLTEKQEYTKALELAPASLWTTECCPKKFLSLESWNAWLAAKRLAKYWMLRSSTFGDKKYHPLHQTGEGALGRKEVSVFGSGFVQLLPNDSMGCSVVLIDTGRLRDLSLTSDVWNRVIFYILSIVSQNEVSQRQGAVLLLHVEEAADEKLIDAGFLHAIADSLPMRFKAIHLLTQVVLSSNFTSSFDFANNTHVHTGRSSKSFGDKLESFGVHKEGLPVNLGGSWGFDRFVQWQELRTRVEWNLPPGLSARENEQGLQFPSVDLVQECKSLPLEERKRRLNVIHSFRKRGRARIELELVKAEISSQEENNKLLQTEGKRLEDLVLAATELVMNIEYQRHTQPYYVPGGSSSFRYF